MIKPYYKKDGIIIYNGDCRKVLPQIKKVDLVLTDPPYGVEFECEGEFKDTFEEWMELISFIHTWAIKKKKAQALILSTSKIEGESWIHANIPPDWRMCWYKGACSTRSHVGFKDWENIFVWGKCWQTPFHDFFYIHPVIQKDNKFKHPCPKPFKWALHLIKKSEALSIVDPFMGSGTTLLAAKQLNRKAIGIEIEEKYCEIAVKKLEEYSKRKKKFKTLDEEKQWDHRIREFSKRSKRKK